MARLSEMSTRCQTLLVRELLCLEADMSGCNFLLLECAIIPSTERHKHVHHADWIHAAVPKPVWLAGKPGPIK